MVICDICGNDIDPGMILCPFCGGQQQALSQEAEVDVGFLHKVINLERGRPFVDSALRKLQMELHTARLQHCCVLTVIHGYGSSGKGGAIRVECRKILAYMKEQGAINTFIVGEEFRTKSGPTRDLLRRFPQLAANINLNQDNPGITLIVL